jgi:hypothetical protein
MYETTINAQLILQTQSQGQGTGGGGGGGGAGCFTEETIVRTHNGRAMFMKDVRVGDVLLTFDNDKVNRYIIDVNMNVQLTYSRVISFLHRLPNDVIEFMRLTLEDGRTLTLTPWHLIFSGTCDDERCEMKRV